MSGDNNTQNPQAPYVSERDVNGDGKNDAVHSQDVDGTRIISHVDADGEVILEEYDLDHDGTYETTAESAGIGTDDVKLQQDVNNDGTFDTREYYDPTTNQSFQKDYLVNDEVVTTVVDTDTDGMGNYQFDDTTGDGKFDTVSVDSDHDGIVNAKFVDTDADGEFDVAHVDVDNTDGILESTVSADQYGDGALGSVSEYEEFITYPADGDNFSGAGDAGGDPSAEGAV